MVDQAGSSTRLLALWKDSKTKTDDYVIWVGFDSQDPVTAGKEFSLGDETIGEAVWATFMSSYMCSIPPCSTDPTSAIPPGKGGTLKFTSDWVSERCATVTGTIAAEIRDFNQTYGMSYFGVSVEGEFVSVRLSTDELIEAIQASSLDFHGQGTP